MIRKTSWTYIKFYYKDRENVASFGYLELSKNSQRTIQKASVKSKIVNWQQTHLSQDLKTVKHKNVRNCPLPPTSTTDRKKKVRRVSEEALTWRGRLHSLTSLSLSCLPVLDPVTCCLQDRPGIGLVTHKPSVLASWSLESKLLNKVLPQPSLLCHH